MPTTMRQRARSITLCMFVVVCLASSTAGAAASPVEPGRGATTLSAPAQDRYARVMQDATVLHGQLDAFWTGELQSQGLQFYAPTRFEYYQTTGNSTCNGQNDPMPRNAYYCYRDRYVAFDVDWLASFLDAHPGDATTFLILSHEWGHAVQDSWSRQQRGVDSWNPSYRKELQADCLAGVFLHAAISRGAIIEQAGDGNAVYGWLSTNGSGPWTDPGSHGTSAQRQAAFYNGYNNSSAYCRKNDF